MVRTGNGWVVPLASPPTPLHRRLLQIASGQLSGNDTWGTDDIVALPDKSDPRFAQVFPPGRNSAWLRAYYPPTIAQDTSVWEMLYIRPRLIQ